MNRCPMGTCPTCDEIRRVEREAQCPNRRPSESLHDTTGGAGGLILIAFLLFVFFVALEFATR